MERVEQWIIKSEEETAQLASALAASVAQLEDGVKIYLKGNLGAGKSTFSRYFIRTFGVEGAIKSPTYTLIEPYQVANGEILHIDLYRLATAEEIYDLGFLEEEQAIWLIEWPEKGQGVLPAADLLLALERDLEELTLTLYGKSQKGIALLDQLSAADRVLE